MYHYLAAGLNESIQSTSCSLSAPSLYLSGSLSASSRTRPSKSSTAQRASSYDKDFRSSHHCATFGVQHLHESSVSGALLYTQGVLCLLRQAVLSPLGSRPSTTRENSNIRQVVYFLGDRSFASSSSRTKKSFCRPSCRRYTCSEPKYLSPRSTTSRVLSILRY